jgi:apolipoprotein N-acyltransferase
VTPWAVRGDATVEAFVEDTATNAKVPILMGSIAIEPALPGEVEERWYNGVFLVDPKTGVNESYYAKQHLVPFGEYVPMRAVLGWLDKLVPVGGDFQTGQGAQTMLVDMGGQFMVVGPLICFEDTFPNLARSSVRSGADILIVLTNNGWFGEGGAAEQHAAHSVLRAVETRRPVLRIGNAGWSGWIDEFGVVRAVLQSVTRIDSRGVVHREVSTDKLAENGSIYFRGSATVDVSRDRRWAGRNSFFVEHGNWFEWVCAGLLALGVVLVRIAKPKKEKTTEAKPPVAL